MVPEDSDGESCSPSEWEEDMPVPVPKSLQRPGKKFLQSMRSQHLAEDDETQFRELLWTEGTTPTVINTIISVTNRFMNFKTLYLDDHPKSDGFNRKVCESSFQIVNLDLTFCSPSDGAAICNSIKRREGECINDHQ